MSDGGRFVVSKSDQNSILDGAGGGGASYGSTDPEAGAGAGPMSPTSQTSDRVTAGDEANYAHDLYLYTDDITERPKVSSMLKSMVNYSAAISSAPADPDSKTAKPRNAQMGTLVGVYLPCLQNIFGVLLFIRMSWIVGTAGVIQGFLVVFMCCCVTFLTSISMSAVATNGVIPAGGSYYMISRALGPEFGGAVGILFYLGTTVAGSMYIIGAVEILLLYIAPQLVFSGDITSDAELKFHYFRLYGTILLFVITCIIFGGVRLVNKFAAVALACVLLSILAVYVGIFWNIGGNDRLKLCMLGHRVLVEDKLGNYSCTDLLKEEGPLVKNFCHVDENNQTHCLDYLTNSNITQQVGIRGLASNAFFDNLKASFVEDAGRYITDTDDPADYGNLGEDENNLLIKADMKTSFVIMVGIFFPSVTGIMAGSNRSGDLKDAQKSIPIGTLAAVCTTSIVYLSSVLLIGGSIDNLLLRDKFGDSVGGRLVVANLAWPNEWVILIGSLLSTIGAGMQSLTGAPRLLQAIAKDEIIPFLRPLAVSSANGEPRRALFLTWFICQISVLIGNLDNITPLLSCFFLMCYGFVNLACAVQTLLRTPNWRPRFKYYHWSMSLTGLGLCAAVMFMCSWYYALCSIGLAIVIYKYIEYRGAEKEWGDGIRGLALSGARYALLRLEEGPPHTKNWRPQILIFVKMDEQLFPKHTKILTFASQLKAGKGLTMAVSVLEGDLTKKSGEQQAARESLRKAIAEDKLKGFVDVLVAQNVIAGLNCLVQTCGIGGMKPNTVLLGWPHSWRKSTDERSVNVFIQTIRAVSAAKMALLVPKGLAFYPDSTEKVTGNIDIWWIVHDGGLLMLLPFLLCQHKTWHNCRMRIFTVAQLEDNSIQMKKDLKMFLYHLRIDADVEIVEMENADISAYTYERTLMMEQRGQMVTKLKTSRRDSKHNVQAVVDQHRASLTGQTPHSPTKVRFAEEPPKEEENVEEAEEEVAKEAEEQQQPSAGVSREGSVKSASSVKETKEFSNLLHMKPTEANVRRMHTAVRLNEVIVNKSHDAKLVVINLPSPPKASKGDSDANYMEFLEVLTEGLDRVLLVRGGGREVITIYS